MKLSEMAHRLIQVEKQFNNGEVGYDGAVRLLQALGRTPIDLGLPLGIWSARALEAHDTWKSESFRVENRIHNLETSLCRLDPIRNVEACGLIQEELVYLSNEVEIIDSTMQDFKNQMVFHIGVDNAMKIWNEIE